MPEQTETDPSPEAFRAADAILDSILPRPRTTVTYVARLIERHRNMGRLREAARWLAHNEPGTPVPEWVDAAVNGYTLAAPERTEPHAPR